MTSKERLAIFENILAKVGIDGDVLGEYTRTLAMMNGLNSMKDVQNMQNLPVQPPLGAVSPTNTPPVGMSTPQEQLPAETPPMMP